MRKNVSIVVSLLARYKIPVTLSGTGAYVQSDAMGRPVCINLPNIPDNSSDNFLDAMRGFLDHEVAHVLFTDFKWRADNVPPNLDHLWNVCEDIFIERKMATALRGCGFNLSKTRKHIINNVFDTALTEAISAPDATPEKIFIKTLCVPVMRALCGQSEFSDWLDDGNKWSHVSDIVAAIQHAKIPEKINATEHTSNSLVAAKLIADILRPSPELKPNDESDKSDTDADTPPSDADDTDEEQPPAEGDLLTDESLSNDNLDTDADKTPNKQDSEDDDTGEVNNASKTEDDDALGDTDSMESIDANYDHLEDDDGDAPLSFESSLEAIIKQETTDGAYAPLASDLDWMGDLADLPSAGKHILEQVGERHGSAWKEGTEKALEQGSASFNRNIEPLLQKGAAMAKEIERLILGQERIHWEGGRRTGQVHGGSLFKLSMGDNRVFRSKTYTKAKNACVLIVNDLSGSMRSEYLCVSRINQALAASYTIADAMDKAKIPCMVTGFTTLGEDNDASLLARIKARGVVTPEILASHQAACDSANRYEPLLHPVLKRWDKPCSSPSVIKNFGFCSGFVPLLRNNVDGESLLAMLPLLNERTEDIKIMLVMSDGDPAAVGDKMRPHLTAVTKYIETQTDVTLIGVGIATETANYYKTASRVDSVDELPKVVCGLIKKALQI